MKGLFWHCTWIISAFVLIYFCIFEGCLYWYVCAYYNGVCIVMFAHLVQYNCWLYFILGVCSYVSHMYGLFFHCIFVKFTLVLICFWMLYLWLFWYVCVLRMTCSLVALHIGDLFMHVSCILFVVLLCHPCWPTFTIVDSRIFVWISCHMYWSTYLCS